MGKLTTNIKTVNNKVNKIKECLKNLLISNFTRKLIKKDNNMGDKKLHQQKIFFLEE